MGVRRPLREAMQLLNEPKRRLMDFLQPLMDASQPSKEAKRSRMELGQRLVETEESLPDVRQLRKEADLRQKGRVALLRPTEHQLWRIESYAVRTIY